MKKALIVAFGKARAGSKRRNIEFNIKIENVLTLAGKTNYRCAVTGLPLSLDRTVGWFRRPFAPSIDRINSGRGYINGNVRVVCCAVNVALGEWGEAVFDVIAKAYASRVSAR